MNDTQPERMVDSDSNPGEKIDYTPRPQYLAAMIGISILYRS